MVAYNLEFPNKNLAYYARNRLVGYLKYMKNTKADSGANHTSVSAKNNVVTIDATLLDVMKRISKKHNLEFRLN